MKRFFIITAFFVSFLCNLHSQETTTDAIVLNYKERGFESIIGMSFIFSEGNSALSFHTVFGYRPNPNFSIGLGVGFESYSGTNLIPVYIDPRVNFIKGKYSPFIYFDVGYAFGKTDSLNSMIQLGPFFTPGLGFKVNFQEQFSFNISIGYRYQMVKFHKDLYLLDGTYTEYNNNEYHMMILRFELSF